MLIRYRIKIRCRRCEQCKIGDVRDVETILIRYRTTLLCRRYERCTQGY